MVENEMISDEIWRTITDKYVLSIAPVIAPTDLMNPYKGMNQQRTAIQMRLAPIGGSRNVFNLSLDQFDTLKRAVEAAQNNITMEKAGTVAPFFWNLADACGDQMTRIFGDPDNEGLCPMRKIMLLRQPIKKNKDGSFMMDKNGKPVFANYPWLLKIAQGKGKKMISQSGGSYPAPGSYKETSSCFMYLSDGQMKEMIFWETVIVNAFNNAITNPVLKGFANIAKQKEAYKKEHQRSYNN